MPSTSSPSPVPDRPVSAVEAPAPGVRRSRAADRALALPHGLLVLLSMAGVVVAVAGLRSASGIVGPAFLALMIVITIHPLLAWLQRHRVPGWLAVVLTMLVASRACWRWPPPWCSRWRGWRRCFPATTWSRR